MTRAADFFRRRTLPKKCADTLRATKTATAFSILTREVYLTAQDVRNLQLAKAAVAAGIDVLLAAQREWKAPILTVCILQAASEAMSIRKARSKIGMLPRVEKDKLHSIGNTALAGAAMMALDPEKRGAVRRIAHDCSYIELSGRADFAAAFAENMSF